MPCLQNTQKRPFPGRESQVDNNRGSTVLQVRHSHFPFSFDLSTVESACCDMCYFLFASSTSIYCQLHFSSLFATTDTLTTTTLLFSFSMLHVIDRPGTLHLSRISNHYTTCYRNSDFSVPLLSHLLTKGSPTLGYLRYKQYRNSESHPCASSFSLKLTKLRTQHRGLPVASLDSTRLDSTRLD